MTTLAGIDLPDNLSWTDEFTWDPVSQSGERTLTGALIVEEDPKIAGRPITLRGAWIKRTAVQALRAELEQINTEMTLGFPDGRTFNVLWRRADGVGFEATPVTPTADPDADTFYEITLRLMEAPT